MTSAERFEAARRRLVLDARALLNDELPTTDFFRHFMGTVADLAGDHGLEGTDLDIFQRLETWEIGTGALKATAERDLRERLTRIVPPDSYRQPIVVWLVEYSDAREPGATFQAGAFTEEEEARLLLARIESEHTPSAFRHRPRSRGTWACNGRPVMSLHKLPAGDGYTYLTRQVAAADDSEEATPS